LRGRALIRLVPALIWLAMQGIMTPSIGPALAAAARMAIERSYGAPLLLCDPAPQVPAKATADPDCRWCQSFGSAIVPQRPSGAGPTLSGPVPHRPDPAQSGALADRTAHYHSRAPPR